MMLRVVIMVCAVCAAWSLWAAAPSPFRLPPSAKVRTTSATGGWMVGAEMPLSYTQAKAQLASRLAAAGWTHVHTIDLGLERSLETWIRGDDELTIMIWREAPNRSAFSYGISGKGQGGGK